MDNDNKPRMGGFPFGCKLYFHGAPRLPELTDRWENQSEYMVCGWKQNLRFLSWGSHKNYYWSLLTYFTWLWLVWVFLLNKLFHFVDLRLIRWKKCFFRELVKLKWDKERKEKNPDCLDSILKLWSIGCPVQLRGPGQESYHRVKHLCVLSKREDVGLW